MAVDPESPLCPDWVYLNNSNVHVAKDRGWFKTYTPFKSVVGASPLIVPGTTLMPVLGIGTVEIPTERSPKLSGVDSYGSLFLREVLHVPDAFCNSLGRSSASSDGYRAILWDETYSNGTIQDKQGKDVAYFDPELPLYVLKTRGYPTGPKLNPHVLEQGGIYALGCHWASTEKEKWEKFKSENGLAGAASQSAGATNKIPGYTAEEKAYLKEKRRSEYHFLIQHGLKIHSEEDRAECRSILRAFMKEDLSEGEPEDDEFDFEGHQADYNFSHSQLDWIEKHYGNSERFVLCYGLKFYDNEDLEEAKAIADAMMADDEHE